MKERFPADARVFQILFLGGLLAAGAWFRDFSVRPEQVGLTFLAGALTQAFFIRLLALDGVGLRSAFITCLSLSLLLRADSLWAHPAAAFLATASKFLVRVRGKHVFNPGNLGVIVAIALLPGTWASPAQWGQDVALAGWIIALGAFVAGRARRGDVAWAFLAFFLGLLALRVAWLGQRWAVWVHQLQNGSLLLFAFFMISDPKTIPDHPRGRIALAAAVALAAFFWQFVLYRTNGLLWALFLCSPLSPVLDLLWPARRFEWETPRWSPVSSALALALSMGLSALAAALPPGVFACDAERVPVHRVVGTAPVVALARASGASEPTEGGASRVRLEVFEVLRGSLAENVLNVEGTLAEHTPPRRRKAPYTMDCARAAGCGGCFAKEYRPGGKYLLLLKGGTPYWAPLAPTNEEVTGPSDPWVQWVRGFLEGVKAKSPKGKRPKGWMEGFREGVRRRASLDLLD